MKKTGLAVALVVCLVAGTAFAGGTPQTSLGTKQLVFQFHGLSRIGLSSYQFSSLCEMMDFLLEESDIEIDDTPFFGGGIGFRYFFGEGLAIRPGVNISRASFESDDEGEEDDFKATFSNMGFSVLLEKYLPTTHSIAPYVGAGLGYDRYSLEAEPVEEYPYEFDKGSVTFSSLDLKGVAGFQWYFTDGISLGGEYLGSFSMGKMASEITDEGKTEDGPEVTLNRFFWDTASVFLSVNF